MTDIIHFGIYYPSADLIGSDLFRFSAAMAILSLLLKPVSCFFVYQMYRERGGDCSVTLGECCNFVPTKFKGVTASFVMRMQLCTGPFR